jgi:UDP-glucose 4-epimerase|tara:strand:- start:786 stop:1787 length:1002 start_codon:yes stop_codon:yes gene_type:complete
MKYNILITGGLGFVGSHIVIKLLENDYNVFIIDNLENSNLNQITKLKKIINKKIQYFQGDLRNIQFLDNFFNSYKIDIVIHCAGLKSVEESERNPLKYYDFNVCSTINLLNTMNKYNVRKLIFSSSACVYGVPKHTPIDEKHETNPNNIYGKTKLINENILKNLCEKNNDWSVVCLRYFNPIGSHETGLIGDNPLTNITNIMPVLNKILNDKSKIFNIYGNTYKTKDGTAIRDYIHIDDLAEGHKLSVIYCLNNNGFETFNLGTGKGYSVLEILNTFKKYTNKKINYNFIKKRQGDVEISYTNTKKAKEKLKFTAKKNLDIMCKDSIRFYNGL